MIASVFQNHKLKTRLKSLLYGMLDYAYKYNVVLQLVQNAFNPT